MNEEVEDVEYRMFRTGIKDYLDYVAEERVSLFFVRKGFRYEVRVVADVSDEEVVVDNAKCS